MLTYTLGGAVLALLTTLPLAWKWELGVARSAVAVLALALLAGLIVAFLHTVLAISTLLGAGLVWLLTVALALAILAYRFYRDPERTAPDRDDVLVSPADGAVLYIRQARGGTLPVSTKHGHAYTLQELTRTALCSEDATVIGIAMSFLEVHVNRAPIAGRITLHRHVPGRFGSLKRPEMVFENERSTTVIERDGLQVAVVQIASRLVRQIASFVREGQEVALGERIGVIRLGSQVDLVLPVRDDVQVTVQPGERVTAGESILALLGPGTPCRRRADDGSRKSEAARRFFRLPTPAFRLWPGW
jgi:phosphatidylserine decarboxylase